MDVIFATFMQVLRSEFFQNNDFFVTHFISLILFIIYLYYANLQQFLLYVHCLCFLLIQQT